MFDQINQLALPVKYAVLLVAVTSVATPIFCFAGFYSSADSAVLAPLAGGVGGYIGGLIRQSLGRAN